nr:unnamed protein product [Callosobruchus analis]
MFIKKPFHKHGTQTNVDIIYLNVGSLLGLFDELTNMVADLKSLILCVSETRITSKILHGEITIIITLLDALDMNYWYILLKIETQENTLYILCVYHSPDASHSKFCSFLETFLEKIYSSQQFINFPTRATCNSSSTIDLAFSNNYDIGPSRAMYKISDHETIVVDLNLHQNNDVETKKFFRNFDFDNVCSY